MKKSKLIPRLMNHAGKYKFAMILSWVFPALGGIASLGPYICIYFVAQELLLAGKDLTLLNSELITRYGWLAVNLTMLSFMLYGLGLVFSHLTAFTLMANLRIQLIRHIGELPLGFHILNPSGKLRKIIEKNTESTENFVAHQLPDTVQAIITPIAFLVSMLFFEWRLALICLIPIAIGFFILSSMLKGESNGLLEYQKAQVDMSNAAVEYVRGISVVKVFGQTVHSFKRFHDSIMDYKKFVTQYALSMEKPMSGYIASVHGIFFVLIPAGIVLYNLLNNLQNFILSFVFFIVFTPLVAVMLMKIMYSSSNQLITTQALDTIENLLNEKPMSQPTHPQRPSFYDIVFDSVSFQYEKDSAKAIDDLSFTAKAGTVTALVGASGGGKSTVANLITRFWDVDSGSICVGSVNVKEMNYNEWMSQVSFVFQDVNLFKMSIAENVAFSKPEATEENILNALHLAQCDDILAKLPNGMHTAIGAKGVYLSGGEMQRIALARAILKDAPVVILDEATAFADPENEYKIQKALDVLMQGKTVLMIAHRLSTITGADQILVMDSGKLIEQGSHKNLIKSGGVYAGMYREYQSGTSWKIRGEAHV
ncbi:ATP-binding cassette domain-containing protein [Alkalibaculum sp. M08DMB]|uniref:ATP-binding cassette domain-containing protein n=1 Tax=Alkalibaculum sporogenes TaxID=2655001 RepID=A0A6A7KBT7_9FIRM|nr:ABC transporter ATP-binding protein [Alkalibaculum sporogenes]MPW26473.1 ATP-binding cassette domain-containing protein [Alkalibaculum sporogenes]